MTTSQITNSNSNGNNQEPIIRRRQVASRRRRDGLLKYARDTTSQNGEDGVIARLFELLPTTTTTTPQRFCVDVGAWDGKHLSNTYSLLLLPLLGNDNCHDNDTNACCWKGLLIEADPKKFQELQALHIQPGNICVNKAVVTTPPGSPHELHAIIQQHAPDCPHDFDFLCVDIDGSDYWVLQGLLSDSSYRPKVICIEFNPTMPDDLIYIPARTDDVRHGASLAALVELAQFYGYVLVETTLFNAFFVPQALYQQYLKEEVPDTSMEVLYEMSMGTSLYQLYDGTLKVWGCKRLLWHRAAIDEKKLQMVPPERRQFPFAPSSAASDDFDMSTAVDMSAICKNNNNNNNNNSNIAEIQKCGDTLLEQLKRDGFAFVRGTGLSQRLCQDALQYTRAFLSDADESVRRSCLTKDRARRGYSPMCTENFASLIGEQGPNDLVRKFRMGPTTKIASNDGIHEITRGDDGNTTSSLLQPNIWPNSEVWDDASNFQATLEEYYESARQTADCVVWAICDALARLKQPDLRAAEVLRSNGNSDTNDSPAHTSILTLLGYKVGTRHKGKNKSPLVAAHTDVGVVTMLLFDSSGCCAQLQRSDEMGGWVDVKLPSAVPDDPVFVVNIGDCMSELTNGILPSTLHRVVADTKQRDARHCLALFVGLDPQAQLIIKDEAMSYEEWRKRRIARALGVLHQNAPSQTIFHSGNY